MVMRCTLPPTGRTRDMALACRAPVPRLETPRLVLRAPDLDDLPAWTRIYNADFGGADDGQAAWTEFSYYTAGWMLHGHGLLTVTDRAEGAVLGFVLLGLEWGDAEPELGWMLLPEARGQGYATEAAAALRDWGADLLGAGGFVSYIQPDNAASIRVAERMGATRDRAAEAAMGDVPCIYRHGGRA